jgi:hypothetical protein
MLEKLLKMKVGRKCYSEQMAPFRKNNSERGTFVPAKATNADIKHLRERALEKQQQHSFIMKLTSAAAILLLFVSSPAKGQDATYEPGNFSEGIKLVE